MKRRTFLTATTAAAAAASLSAPAIARGRRVLRMAMAWPRGFPGFGTSAAKLAETITAASGGALTVKIYGAGELVPVDKMFDAVSSGRVDMYHAIEYYWEGKSKAYNFFASMPFGMTAVETDTWLTKYGGQDLWDLLAGRFNIKPFAVGNTGMQMGGWFNRPINSIGDFQGLKIRATGLTAAIYRSYGAKPVLVPGGEVVTALKKGQIDAAEWVGPWNDTELGLDQAAKYYYYPGFQEPGTQVSMGMNLDLWVSLSESHKEVIRMACRSENVRMLGEFNTRNALALGDIIKGGKVVLRQFPPEVLNTIGKSSGEIAVGSVKGDPLGQKILNNYLSARYQLLRWTKVAEEAFLAARGLPFAYNRTTMVEGSAPSAPLDAAPQTNPDGQPAMQPEQQLLHHRSEVDGLGHALARGDEMIDKGAPIRMAPRVKG